MRWATINGSGFVVRIDEEFPGNSPFVYEIPEGVSCGIGWRLELDTYYPPKWTSYEFFLRLTPTERAAIRQLTNTDPNVADFLMLAQSAQEIVSSDPMTQAGMNYMVSVGVFTEQRKNEVLGLPE
jgi:hypothetical protein